MNNIINIDEIVRVEQLPKIFENLETVGKIIDEKIKSLDLDNMICDEEHKKEVKSIRTQINNLTNLMEDKRKEIKKKILADYEVFNEKYEEEVKSKLTYANGVLKDKIDEIESEQKHKKEEELVRFAEEHIKSAHLEGIIEPKDVLPTVTLSASEKSLKEGIMSQIESIQNTVILISREEYSDEIMVEYKKSLDYIKAKTTVLERHKQLEEMQKAREQVEVKQQEEQKIAKKVEEIVAPIEIQEEKLVTSTFKVTATMENLKKIKAFLEELGVDYE